HEAVEAGRVGVVDHRAREVVDSERRERGRDRAVRASAADLLRRQIDGEGVTAEQRQDRLPTPRAVRAAVNEDEARRAVRAVRRVAAAGGAVRATLGGAL